MKPLRPQLRGLIFKLGLFYVLLSLPCLVLVESALLIYEFEDFMGAIDAGALLRASEHGARDLAEVWPSAAQDEARGLSTWTGAWVLRLQRPRGELVRDESFMLEELALDPIAAAVLAPDGRVLAKSPAQATWQLELPRAGDAEFRAALAGGAAQSLSGADSPYRIRRVLTPVRDAGGTVRGLLLVELRLPLPWHRFLLDLSLEWPIVLGYLLVFGVASSLFLATWVTRRLGRVAKAATAWSRGDFANLIADPSRDELGRLSALLDAMALELKALMRSRAQLATLAERQRLARDLHDTVKQKAFALNLQLATARRQLGTPAGAERLAQAERLSQQIQQELVQMLDELKTTDALPLPERLRARAEDWAQISGVALTLDLDASVPPLAPAHEDALLRVLDEALANVLRHSGARRALVRLAMEGDALAFEIADDGRGARSDARPGMGLSNMRERALSLPAGQFEFTSSADRGTRVSLRFSATGASAS